MKWETLPSEFANDRRSAHCYVLNDHGGDRRGRTNMSKSSKESLSYWEVTAIGVGGMVGGGIFAVLGLSVQLTSGGAPVAFLIAGVVALVTAYSYAHLSVTYPSQGGTVAFLDRAFGPGVLTGSINILLWISYIVMLSLYAYAFGSYGASFFPPDSQIVWKHILITGSVFAITGLNLLNARLIGEAEGWVVLLKVVILLLFIGVGIWFSCLSLAWASGEVTAPGWHRRRGHTACT